MAGTSQNSKMLVCIFIEECVWDNWFIMIVRAKAFVFLKMPSEGHNVKFMYKILCKRITMRQQR